ncbi:MEDS domain-containing protein [Nonomuraea thailandensis]
MGAGDAPEQAAFEAATNELFGERWLAAVCQYDRALFPRDAIDRAASVHPIAPEQALLRFASTFEPAGLRVWGTSTSPTGRRSPRCWRGWRRSRARS